MKLAISNIAWPQEMDAEIYEEMKSLGFQGLEIAPTRILQSNPYDRTEEICKWNAKLNLKYGFCIPSMQSIWYGRTEKIFGQDEERAVLLSYTKKAIDFAETIGCRNLVFGCPQNRKRIDGVKEDIAENFFREIGDYAFEHNTVIGMEANPPIYNTNYVNDTISAFNLIQKVDSKGFRLNLDLGTMIYNGEEISSICTFADYINHVHISEPFLKPIVERKLHYELKKVLSDGDYRGFVSIEMGCQKEVSVIKKSMEYVRSVFT